MASGMSAKWRDISVSHNYPPAHDKPDQGLTKLGIRLSHQTIANSSTP